MTTLVGRLRVDVIISRGRIIYVKFHPERPLAVELHQGETLTKHTELLALVLRTSSSNSLVSPGSRV